MPDTALTELVADIVGAYVSNNSIAASELPTVIASVYAALSAAGDAPAPVDEASQKLTPAQIRKSITPDALISFVDGKSYKTLKRHLTTHGLTFEAYKAKFGLPSDYPTTSPSYSAKRSEMAKKLGLGSRNVRGRKKKV